MAKEIDKIIQSKTAPKSNNVLWDDGENLKINRNGKWESTGSGTSIPQEKLDSIDFGYYTYASGNIVANWGPFTIKEGETIKVETNTWTIPEFIRIHDYSKISYVEKGIHELSKHPDDTLYYSDINIKPQGTTLEIYNNSFLGTVTISFLGYKKQYIDSSKFKMSTEFLAEMPLTKYIFSNIGERCEIVYYYTCIGKDLRLDWGQGYYGGFCVQVEYIENGYRFTLLKFPHVAYVTYIMDDNRILTDVQIEEKTISVV